MYNCIYSLRLKCIFNTFLLFLNVFIIIVFHFYTSFSNVSTAVIFIYAGLFLSTFWERGGGGVFWLTNGSQEQRNKASECQIRVIISIKRRHMTYVLVRILFWHSPSDLCHSNVFQKCIN